MGQVIDLDDRRSGGGGPAEPSYSPRSYDVVRVRLALLKVLPPDVCDLISSDDLTGIADLVVRTVDEARKARLLDPTADRRSEAHEWMAPLTAAHDLQRGQQPSTPARGEYEALRDLIDGPPADDPPGPASA